MDADETSTPTPPTAFTVFTTITAAADDGERNLTEWNATTASYEEDWRAGWYRWVVPVMIAFCAVSLVTNMSILVSVPWVRRRSLNPTLCLSISLAVADAYASLYVGTGLLLFSLLPVGFNVIWENQCYALTIEALRLAGLAVSTLHLLMLAVNHYVGIVRPLHYASTVTRRAALVSIAVMWTVPVLFFLLYFASISGEGYQSPLCNNLRFMGQLTFRVVVGSIFYIPLALMCFMYVHIFIIVMQHNRGLQQYQKQGSSNRNSETGAKKQSNNLAFRHNVKAALTTLLILGTYVVSLMPAVTFFVLVCENCAVGPRDVDETVMFLANMTINTLMILKLFVNPMVYAARMKDIRGAMRRMVASCLCEKDGDVTSYNSHGGAEHLSTYSFSRSRHDTLLSSLRKHSVADRGRYQRNSPNVTLIYQRAGGGAPGGDNGTLTAPGSVHNNHHQRNGSVGSDVTVTTYLTANTISTSCVADF